ncbi:MAG: hypothetical protein HY876_02520 [Coriobacteriales bacterium]|nr:hypothetical protein [Coriobacteriales bacterium]
MAPTTPPRPLDITAHFPDLREHSATATRLHPRRGTPTVANSSVGGPLLWPADEPWPVCTDGSTHYASALVRPATARRRHEIYAATKARASMTGNRYELTDEERAELPAYDFSEPHHLLNQPIPLVAVAQLYRRDILDFAGPPDADLLQVLWRPLDHPEEGYNPRVQLRWRRSTDVTERYDTPPEPPVVNEDYLPSPCVVHPEQVIEYPYIGLLPDELSARITAWEHDHDDSAVNYQYDLSLAPGWKVGGFADWSLTDPVPMSCAVCGADMTLLFTAASDEGSPTDSWRAVDGPDEALTGAPDVQIGRGYSLYVFRCLASFAHPPATAMQ